MLLRRVLVTTALVAVLASSLFSGWLTASPSILKPPLAQAAGKAIFEIKNSTKPTFFRKSETELAVTARIKVSEAGSTPASNETFAYITVSQTYSKVGSVTGFGNKIFDTWRISSVSMSSLNIEASYGQTNSKIISPTLVEFYNRSNDLVARLDYSRLPTDAITSEKSPCFQIGATGSHRIISSRDNGDCNGTGVSGDSRTPVTAVASYTADPTDAVVDNYQLAPGASEGASVSKIQSWIRALMTEDKGALRILVPTDQTTPQPPYIAPSESNNFIPADPSVGRPQLYFKLVAASFNGARGTLDQKWLIFQAYGRTDTSGPFEKIDNFYYLVESGGFIESSGHRLNIIYDTDQTNVFIGIFSNQSIENGGALVQGGGGLSIPDADINKVFGYIMNVPKANRSDNCDDSGGVYKTGRPGADIEGATTKEIYDKHPDTVTTNANNTASNIHSNCGTRGGWLQYWSVKINFARDGGGGGCSLNVLTKIQDGVGTMIVTIFACVIQSLIDNIYKPLSDITQGAGKETGVLESNLAGTGANPQFVAAWKFSLGLINVIVILALLAIAFANILHLNINTYTAKKALPGLVIGVVGANASMLLIRFLLDVAKSLQVFAFQIANNPPQFPVNDTGQFVAAFMNAIGMTAFENKTINFVAVAALPLTFIILLIFAIYMLYLTVVFAWGMVKRLVYIYGLTILAPIAFVTYGVPGQQQWFTKWWDMMLRQIFMLPIVFLAAAFLIRFTKVTVQPPNSNLGPADVSNLINMALVFLTATAILKLPGLITKGAIDISGAAKKAFGMAKQTPLRAVSNYQGAHEFFKGGGKQRLSAGFYRKLGFKDLAKNRADTARKNRLGYKKKYEGSLKWIKGARGYTKLVDDPGILWDAYQEKVKQTQKDDKIAALTKTHRIPGKLRGGPAEAILQRGLAREEMKDATDKADYADWNTGLGGGHLDKVYGKERKNIPDGVWKAILDAAGGNEEVAETIRRRMGALGSEEAVLNFIEKDVNDGGLGIANQWDIADLMKAVGYESRLTEGANRVRISDDERRSAGSREAVMLLQRMLVDPDGNRGRARWVPPPGGGGGAPAPSGAAAPSGAETQKVFVTNLNPENEALAGRLSQHADSLAKKLGAETIAKLAGEENVGQIITAEMRNTLQGELGSLFDNPDLVRTVLRAGAGGGSDVIRQHLMAGQAIHQCNTALGSQTAQISDEQLEQLGNTISASNEEALKAVGGLIAPHLENISKASGAPIDPKISQQYAQRIIDGFRQVMTTGPKSMRSYLQSNLTTLAGTFAKEQNIGHITPESIAKAISQAESQRPAPQQGSDVTNIKNVEQTTTVETAPAQPLSSDQSQNSITPEHPVPPTATS